MKPKINRRIAQMETNDSVSDQSKQSPKALFRILIILLALGVIFIVTIYMGHVTEPVADKNGLEAELRQRRDEEIKKNRAITIEEFERALELEKLGENEADIPNLNMQPKAGLKKDLKSVPPAGMVQTDPKIKKGGHTPLSGRFTIQIASLTDESAASRLVEKIRKNGFPAYSIKVIKENGEVNYRIRVGEYQSKTDADKALKQLTESGSSGFIVVR